MVMFLKLKIQQDGLQQVSDRLQTSIYYTLSSFDFQSRLILAVLLCKIGSIYFFRAGVTHHSDLNFFFGFCLLYTRAIGINFHFCDSLTFQKRSILEIVSRAAYLLNRFIFLISSIVLYYNTIFEIRINLSLKNTS